jgi:hypothetical protein
MCSTCKQAEKARKAGKRDKTGCLCSRVYQTFPKESERAAAIVRDLTDTIDASHARLLLQDELNAMKSTPGLERGPQVVRVASDCKAWALTDIQKWFYPQTMAGRGLYSSVYSIFKAWEGMRCCGIVFNGADQTLYAKEECLVVLVFAYLVKFGDPVRFNISNLLLASLDVQGRRPLLEEFASQSGRFSEMWSLWKCNCPCSSGLQDVSQWGIPEADDDAEEEVDDEITDVFLAESFDGADATEIAEAADIDNADTTDTAGEAVDFEEQRLRRGENGTVAHGQQRRTAESEETATVTMVTSRQTQVVVSSLPRDRFWMGSLDIRCRVAHSQLFLYLMKREDGLLKFGVSGTNNKTVWTRASELRYTFGQSYFPVVIWEGASPLEQGVHERLRSASHQAIVQYRSKRRGDGEEDPDSSASRRNVDRWSREHYCCDPATVINFVAQADDAEMRRRRFDEPGMQILELDRAVLREEAEEGKEAIHVCKRMRLAYQTLPETSRAEVVLALADSFFSSSSSSSTSVPRTRK